MTEIQQLGRSLLIAMSLQRKGLHRQHLALAGMTTQKALSQSTSPGRVLLAQQQAHQIGHGTGVVGIVAHGTLQARPGRGRIAQRGLGISQIDPGHIIRRSLGQRGAQLRHRLPITLQAVENGAAGGPEKGVSGGCRQHLIAHPKSVLAATRIQ